MLGEETFAGESVAGDVTVVATRAGAEEITGTGNGDCTAGKGVGEVASACVRAITGVGTDFVIIDDCGCVALEAGGDWRFLFEGSKETLGTSLVSPESHSVAVNAETTIDMLLHLVSVVDTIDNSSKTLTMSFSIWEKLRVKIEILLYRSKSIKHAWYVINLMANLFL